MPSTGRERRAEAKGASGIAVLFGSICRKIGIPNMGRSTPDPALRRKAAPFAMHGP